MTEQQLIEALEHMVYYRADSSDIFTYVDRDSNIKMLSYDELQKAFEKFMDEKLKKLVKEFLDILDEKEESDSGTEFHPVFISSCRVLKTKRIGELLNEMKEIVY